MARPRSASPTRRPSGPPSLQTVFDAGRRATSISRTRDSNRLAERHKSSPHAAGLRARCARPPLLVAPRQDHGRPLTRGSMGLRDDGRCPGTHFDRPRSCQARGTKSRSQLVLAWRLMSRLTGPRSERARAPHSDHRRMLRKLPFIARKRTCVRNSAATRAPLAVQLRGHGG